MVQLSNPSPMTDTKSAQDFLNESISENQFGLKFIELNSWIAVAAENYANYKSSIAVRKTLERVAEKATMYPQGGRSFYVDEKEILNLESQILKELGIK